MAERHEVIGDMARAVQCPTPLFDASAPIYTAAMGQGPGAERHGVGLRGAERDGGDEEA